MEGTTRRGGRTQGKVRVLDGSTLLDTIVFFFFFLSLSLSLFSLLLVYLLPYLGSAGLAGRGRITISFIYLSLLFTLVLKKPPSRSYTPFFF